MTPTPDSALLPYKVLPKIELPSQEDFKAAEDFHDFNGMYTDEQRKAINDTAYKIFLNRKTKQ